jgi:hypothetical protein
LEVDSVILVITGFLKPHLGQRRGLVGIYQELKDCIGPDRRVALYGWRDYDKILKDLRRWKPRKVYLIGHSYGAGTGNYIAEALQFFPNVRIPYAIWVDFIWRSNVYKISKLSLDDQIKAKVANNIEKLLTVEQDGEPLNQNELLLGPNTEWVMRKIVDRNWRKLFDRHALLDANPVVREIVMEVILGS